MSSLKELKKEVDRLKASTASTVDFHEDACAQLYGEGRVVVRMDSGRAASDIGIPLEDGHVDWYVVGFGEVGEMVC